MATVVPAALSMLILFAWRSNSALYVVSVLLLAVLAILNRKTITNPTIAMVTSKRRITAITGVMPFILFAFRNKNQQFSSSTPPGAVMRTTLPAGHANDAEHDITDPGATLPAKLHVCFAPFT
jgi:hypothetical protein